MFVDDEVTSTQKLIEKLNEAVTVECSRLTQVRLNKKLFFYGTSVNEELCVW